MYLFKLGSKSFGIWLILSGEKAYRGIQFLMRKLMRTPFGHFLIIDILIHSFFMHVKFWIYIFQLNCWFNSILLINIQIFQIWRQRKKCPTTNLTSRIPPPTHPQNSKYQMRRTPHISKKKFADLKYSELIKFAVWVIH